MFVCCRERSHVIVVLFFSCLVLFFFFKQKTAYEMRISDWSSDVCSSDLFDQAFKSMLANPADLDVTFRYAELAIQIGDFEAAIKIGRASCRERVCQYV